MTTRILMIDDQVLFVEGLRSVITTRAQDMEVVSVAYNANEGIERAIQLKPDIVLMDVRMPGTDGVEATRLIRAKLPGTKVIMLTTYDDDQYVTEAIANGAFGYLLKDVPPDDLINSIRAIASGNFLVAAEIAQKVIHPKTGDAYHGGVGDSDLPEWYYVLSRKERQVLRNVVEGSTNDEIADSVNLAPQTVKNYISKLYEVVGVHGRLNLIKASRPYLKFL